MLSGSRCLLIHVFCFSDVTVELPLTLMTPKPEGGLFSTIFCHLEYFYSFKWSVMNLANLTCMLLIVSNPIQMCRRLNRSVSIKLLPVFELLDLNFHLRPADFLFFKKLQEIGINASSVWMRPAVQQVSSFSMAAPHAPAKDVHVEWLEEGERNLPPGTENTEQKELKERQREGAWPLKANTTDVWSSFPCVKEPCLMY